MYFVLLSSFCLASLFISLKILHTENYFKIIKVLSAHKVNNKLQTIYNLIYSYLVLTSIPIVQSSVNVNSVMFFLIDPTNWKAVSESFVNPAKPKTVKVVWSLMREEIVSGISEKVYDRRVT